MLARRSQHLISIIRGLVPRVFRQRTDSDAAAWCPGRRDAMQCRREESFLVDDLIDDCFRAEASCL